MKETSTASIQLADGQLVTFELQEDGTRRVVEPIQDAGRQIIQVKAGFILLAVLLLGMCQPAYAGVFPTTYDAQIKEAWGMYYPGNDWRWWKSQLWQESHLKPDAVSPVGAAGIAQFMPATARQYGLVDRRLAGPSILAGARMMRDLRRFWKAPRTQRSREELSQASYNAGAGNLLKAQKRCNGCAEYDDIAPCLHLVTGHYSKETLGYVRNIRRWFGAML